MSVHWLIATREKGLSFEFVMFLISVQPNYCGCQRLIAAQFFFYVIPRDFAVLAPFV